MARLIAGRAMVTLLAGFLLASTAAVPAAAAGPRLVEISLHASTTHPGYPVTLSVSVRPWDGGSVVPSGSVEILQGSRTVAAGTLAHGDARFDLAPFEGGSHQLLARYSGDGVFAPKEHQRRFEFAKYQLDGGAATSAGGFVIWPDGAGRVDEGGYPKAKVGEPVQFTASFWVLSGHNGLGVPPPPGIVPTGEVTFWDGNSQMGRAPLVDSSARITVANLTPGRHSIVMRYGPDPYFELGGGGRGLFIDILSPPAGPSAGPLPAAPATSARSATAPPAAPGGSAAGTGRAAAPRTPLSPRGSQPPGTPAQTFTVAFDLGV